MATASIVGSFYFCASPVRPQMSSKHSLNLARLFASSFTLKQPLLRRVPASFSMDGLFRQVPASFSMDGLFRRVPARLLDAFVDLAFQFADQPWLPSQSNFMPVEEIDEAMVITNIEGNIPDNFPEGVYIRNGSNPLFGTLQSASSALGLSSETWMEGEGMLHCLSFSRDASGSWTVFYKNRYVESKTLQIERCRSRPAFLPVVEGDTAAILASVLFNQLRHGKLIKDLSNTSVFEHSGKVFAAAELHMPLEIDALSLETIGDWDLSGAWCRPFIAHPKRAPDGELVIAGVDVKKPFLVLGVVSADGKELIHKVDTNLERSVVCHDIGVTKRFNIILNMPLIYNFGRLMKGGSFLKYEKESYGRIGVMPRYGNSDSIKWFDVEAYCTFHLVNCYEDGDEVVVRGGRSQGSIVPGSDFGRNKFQWFSDGFKNKLTSEEDDCNHNKGLFCTRLHEWRLNMKTGSVRERYQTGNDFSFEFPICNDRFVGLHNRYAYAQVIDSEASSICAFPKFGGMIKFYLDEGYSNMALENDCGSYIKTVRHELGANKFCSGVAFISKWGGVLEDDGWVISFVHDEHTNTSQGYIAGNFGLKLVIQRNKDLGRLI